MAKTTNDKKPKADNTGDDILLPLAATTELHTRNKSNARQLLESIVGSTAEEYAENCDGLGTIFLGIGSILAPRGETARLYKLNVDCQATFATVDEIKAGKGYTAQTIAWADEEPAKKRGSTYSGKTIHASYEVKPRAGEVSETARETFTRVASAEPIPDAPERQYAPGFNPIG